MGDTTAEVGIDALRYNELVERALVRIRSVGMEPYLDLGSETRSGTRLKRSCGRGRPPPCGGPPAWKW